MDKRFPPEFWRRRHVFNTAGIDIRIKKTFGMKHDVIIDLISGKLNNRSVCFHFLAYGIKINENDIVLPHPIGNEKTLLPKLILF